MLFSHPVMQKLLIGKLALENPFEGAKLEPDTDRLSLSKSNITWCFWETELFFFFS
jgi:hypothetical protein